MQKNTCSAHWPAQAFKLTLLCALGLGDIPALMAAEQDIQFNLDVLDIADRANIDLGNFSRSGYILPGAYSMAIHVNRDKLPEHPVNYYSTSADGDDSQACVTPELVALLGFKEGLVDTLAWWRDGECLDIERLAGMQAKGDLATSTLRLIIPQEYLEYSSANWDPPSRWDAGVSGLLLDYNLNTEVNDQYGVGSTHEVSGNGVAGANLGSWRLRADWQGRFKQGAQSSEAKGMEWTRYYAYRALPSLRSTLMVGENYLDSALFDSFRYTGVMLSSDDRQLPPNLRGYAPEVVGVANTNAKVVISQQGRVLYETQVAAGPFRIRELDQAVQGQLDVRVEEQDGSVNTFQVDTANIPYLTRPGSIRYKLAVGMPSNHSQSGHGQAFGMGDFSWGVSSGWSLFGGAIGDGNYNALSLGVGRDLSDFGAVSLDVVRSDVTLPHEGRLSGSSYRINYSKTFDEYDSQITFAGYRFSEHDFVGVSEYIDSQFRDDTDPHWLETDPTHLRADHMQDSKELYSIYFNKQFSELNLSSYLSYSRQTYWSQAASERLSLTVSKNFNIGQVKNVSLSLMATRMLRQEEQDNSLYVSLSFPLGASGRVGTTSNMGSRSNSHAVRYNDQLNDRSNYQLSTGIADDAGMASGYLKYNGELADIDANASYQHQQYSAYGVSVRGGATLTPEGGALHRTSSMGGTRLMVDTAGVVDVPVKGYGLPTRSNMFGKAVVADINSYSRSAVSIDLDSLPSSMEPSASMTELTLTDGAIGYRPFDIVTGQRAMAVIRTQQGEAPPFGSSIFNQKGQQVGIMDEDGRAYLSGIQAGGEMQVRWAKQVCAMTLPVDLPEDTLSTELSLSCQVAAVEP